MRKTKPKKKQVNVRISDDVRDSTTEMAKFLDLSFNAYVNRALRERLAQDQDTLTRYRGQEGLFKAGEEKGKGQK